MRASDVVEAFVQAAKVTKEHDDAFAGYDGWSWGWAGENFITAKQRALNEAERILGQYIQEQIQVAIGLKS